MIMELFKTSVPAYSWLFIYFRKYWNLRIKLIEKLSRRHLINSFDVFDIKGFTVYILFSTLKLEGYEVTKLE